MYVLAVTQELVHKVQSFIYIPNVSLLLLMHGKSEENSSCLPYRSDAFEVASDKRLFPILSVNGLR